MNITFLVARRRCIAVRGPRFILRSVSTATDPSGTDLKVSVNVGKHSPSPTARKDTASSLTKKPSLFPPKSGPSAGSSLPSQNTPKNAADNPRERSTEETLDEIELLLRMSGKHPTVDVWGQPMETLGV
jgi:hypothetical protein